MKLRILITFVFIAIGFLIYQNSDVFAATGLGLPCPNGGPDFRGRMVGKFPPRLQRMDETGENIRYSPGFDAAYRAQCINPSDPNALQNLFSMIKADEEAGIVTKCRQSDDISFDANGNLQLCSDEADSYITITTDGNWSWDYYDTGGGGGGNPFGAPPNPAIPTEGLPSFGQLVEMIFTWSLNILGIVVFVMIFFAGFKWFTAAGNTARVNEAKAQITNAVTGAIILLAAYIILYTINPDLVGGMLTLPGLGK